jgi:protein-disulfide isomerase
VLCLIALIVLAGLGVASARYRPLVREAFDCVFRRITLRKCTSGFDQRVNAALTGRVMRTHPGAARLLHRHLEAIAWVFVFVLVGSTGYVAYGLSNYYRYGSCYGPVQRGFCIFDPTGRRSQYSGIVTEYRGRATVPGDGGAPALGAADAPVTVIEFGSYTCPYTRRAAAAVDELLARHGEAVRFVYRQFPLDAPEAAGPTCVEETGEAHAGSTLAAIAAGCARAQSRFWEYHRLLLSRPEALATCGGLVGLAREVGLDEDRFTRCLAEKSMWEQVHRDFEDGVRAGLYGTPTFYVNGAPLVAPSADELEDAVRRARERVRG